MRWETLSIGDGLLLGDFNPWPIIYPVAGSTVIGGIFLSLAIISGGIWLVRRSQNRPEFSSRKFFLCSLAGVACSIAVVPGVIFVFFQTFLALMAAAALLATAVILLILGFHSSRGRRVEPTEVPQLEAGEKS